MLFKENFNILHNRYIIEYRANQELDSLLNCMDRANLSLKGFVNQGPTVLLCHFHGNESKSVCFCGRGSIL